VVGVDLSIDQLRVARSRTTLIVRTDAVRLPFRDGTFETAVSTFTHSDVPDFGALVREVVRILRPGGTFAYVGVHPCFVNHAAGWRAEGIVVGPGYAERGYVESSPVFREGGLRARVGEYHIGLDGLMSAFLIPELTLRRVKEIAGGFGLGPVAHDQLPGLIAISATKRTRPEVR
jgi:SAM-dependent methyltransferase